MESFTCYECHRRSKDFIHSSLVGGRRRCKSCSGPDVIDPTVSGMRAEARSRREVEMFTGRRSKFRTFKDVDRAAKAKGFVPYKGEMPRLSDKENKKREEERELKWQTSVLDQWMRDNRTEL